MRIDERGWRLVLGAVLVMPVALLLLQTVRAAHQAQLGRFRPPAQVDGPIHRPADRFLEEQFYGISPSSLILYAPSEVQPRQIDPSRLKLRPAP